MSRLSTLEKQCRACGVLAVYLFGSRVSAVHAMPSRRILSETGGPAGRSR